MPNGNTDYRYFMWVLILAGALFLASQLPIPIKGPESWLKEWTTWFATYIGIGVSARGLWIISKEIAIRIKNKPNGTG